MLRQFIDKHSIAWGYAVEVVAALMVSYLLGAWLTWHSIAKFVFARKSDLLSTVGVMAAICGLFYAAFVAFLCTDLGKYLRIKGVAADYLVGFSVPFIALASAASSLHFVSGDTA